MNRLVYGDNLLTMQALLAGDPQTGLPSLRGKVDLIYIDPPFDSKADYRTKVKLPGVDLQQKPTVVEQFAYADTWEEGTISYLKMIYKRLVLMKELLSSNGCIYVHIDWHVGPYVKTILDDIFGKENFVNEIVWSYSWGIRTDSRWNRKHDTIYMYSKSAENIKFNANEVLEERQVSESTANRLKYKGALIKDGNKGRGDSELALPSDVWYIATINGMAKERLNYATQKPEALLERIIKASSNEGDLCLRFLWRQRHHGSGSRKAGSSLDYLRHRQAGILVMRKRFIDQEVNPFLYQSIGDYQKEAFHNNKKLRRVGDLSQVVLGLFGALPFSPEQVSDRNFGYVKGTRNLVMVDSPNRLTTAATVRRAVEAKASLLGGDWDKVIVLGWNFAFDISQAIEKYKNSNVEVLVIPPDLLDKLSKKGFKKLIADKTVRFSSCNIWW